MQLRVRDKLGEGGFGAVYRADVLEPGGVVREVALKVLRADAPLGSDALARLRDEARLLGRVRHRALPAVHGVVRLAPGWTLVLEHVEGVDLDVLLAHHPLPPTVALEVVEEVAGALDAVWHARHGGRPLHLLHRDVKPANVRITPWGGVRLLDFGAATARGVRREARTVGIVLGTPRYLAPERWRGEDEPASDVYALGGLLVDALAGGEGGTDPSGPEAWRARALEVVETLTGVTAAGREALREVALACLAERPEERPAAGELAARCRALRRGLEGPGLVAWAPGRVAALAAARPTVRDAWCGRVLSAQTSGSRDRPLRVLAAALSLVAAGLWGAAGALAASWHREGPVPAPVPELRTEAEPPPAPAVEPVGPPVPGPRRVPPPRAGQPRGATRLELQDAPPGVVLRGPEGEERPPGGVPPGLHEVWAPFGGRLVRWASVDVPAGVEVSLRCQTRRPVCRP